MDKRKKTIELLEAMQSVYYKNHNEFINQMNDFYNSVDKSVNDMLKNNSYHDDGFRLDLVEPESKYQNKHFYNIYFHKIREVEKAYRTLFTFQPIPTPVFGTIPKPGFYTNIIKDETTEPIIIISEGLRAFTFTISRIVSMALKIVELNNGMDVITTKKYIKKNIRENNLDELYAAMLLKYYFIGESHHFGIDFPSKPHMYLTTRMTAAINYFVLAHEYCHCLLSHFDIDTSDNNEAQKQSWRNEAIADRYAIITTINIMFKEGNPDYLIWGIYVFLSALETFEIYDLAINGVLNFDRHPPIKIRKKVLFDVMSELGITQKRVGIDVFDYMFFLLRAKFSELASELKVKNNLLGV